MANQDLAVQESASVRFANLVEREMQSKFKQGLDLTNEQKRLIQNYFIAIDKTLATAEIARQRKSDKYKDPVECSWKNVDLNQIATDVVHFSRLGLDPCQKNNLFVIPFKNNKTGRYDMQFMPGYIGLEIVTKKYALEVPLDVTVELVCENDSFKMFKKGKNQPCDDYEFNITNPFDRGEIIGGFAYIQYREPAKNKLLVMTKKDIKKRMNAGSANAEFWGGEKEVWDYDLKKKVKKNFEGWKEEMYIKTIKRKVYGGNVIPIDPRLIDETYTYLKQREQDAIKAEMEQTIEAETASIVVDDYKVNADTGEVLEEPEQAPQPEAYEEESEEDFEQAEFDEKDFEDDPGY